MIEQLTPPPPWVSLFEAILARRLLELRGLQFDVDIDLCGRHHTTLEPGASAEPEPLSEPQPEPSPAPEPKPAAQPVESEVEPEPEPDPDDSLPARFGAFSRLLEAGAGHLAAARAAHVEQCRQAVQVRELATFAALRPAGVLDRPDEEVGSAAAESRVARPAALMGVSEWAVDEVIITVMPSSSPSTRLRTRRTARSRTSSGYFLGAAMTSILRWLEVVCPAFRGVALLDFMPR
jgi:hypothetical protein